MTNPKSAGEPCRTPTFEQWDPLVLHVLKRMNVGPRHSSYVDNDDLIQEGRIALLNAIKLFKPSLGVQFKTYAYTAIIRAMKYHLVRSGTTVSVSCNRFKFKNEHLKYLDEKAHHCSFLGNREPCIPSPASGYFDMVDRRDDLLAIRKKLRNKNSRDKKILAMHMRGYSFDAIGRAMGCSRQRVNKLYHNLIKATREELRIGA